MNDCKTLNPLYCNSSGQAETIVCFVIRLDHLMSDEQQNHSCSGQQAVHVKQSRILLEPSWRPLPTHQTFGY